MEEPFARTIGTAKKYVVPGTRKRVAWNARLFARGRDLFEMAAFLAPDRMEWNRDASLIERRYWTRRMIVTGTEPSGRAGTFQESSSPFSS